MPYGLADFIQHLQQTPREGMNFIPPSYIPYGDLPRNEQETSADSLASLRISNYLNKIGYNPQISLDTLPPKGGGEFFANNNSISISSQPDNTNGYNGQVEVSRQPSRWHTLNHELAHYIDYNKIPLPGIPDAPVTSPDPTAYEPGFLVRTLNNIFNPSDNANWYVHNWEQAEANNPEWQKNKNDYLDYAKNNPTVYAAKDQQEYNAQMFANYWRQQGLQMLHQRAMQQSPGSPQF